MSDGTVSNSSHSKHLEFYIHTVTFLVEDCLFRIPREPLEAESIVFRDMFLLPQGKLEAVEGQSDTCPVILQGVSKKDFECLLRALMYRQHGTHKGLNLDHDQWISVLKLSTMWEFNELRNAAIQHLDPPSQPLNPADKFALALKYDIKKWLLPALMVLVRRSEPISVEEGRLIGFENALKLAAVRELLTMTMVRDQVSRDYTLKSPDERSMQNPQEELEKALIFISFMCKTFDL